MARGYPDYFGMPAFPGWGVPTVQTSLVANIASMANADIFSLTGKGKIGGGYFRIQGSAGLATEHVTVTIDGVVTLGVNATIAFDRGLTKPGFLPIFLTSFSPEAFVQAYGFLPELIYGQSFIINVTNTDPGLVIPEGYLIYFNVI